MEISIYNTYISPLAKKLVCETLDTSFISAGDLAKKFEDELADNLGLKNPVTVNSGTSALHLALVLAGVNEGDEVIIPAQTFVATGLVVIQQKATPVFADIDYNTGNISVQSIIQKITNKTKAIIPVHWAGYPCDLDEINSIAKKHNIKVIEDAAHALGAEYKNRMISSISDYTCFSFQAIKHVTTGDGGAVCTNDDEKYNEAVTKRWFGIDRTKSMSSELGERQYDIDGLGYKYHLNDYAAALGIANLNNFKERLAHRRLIASIYDESLNDVTDIKLFDYEKDRKSAYWLYGFHVEKRIDFIRKLKEKGIAASVVHQRIDRNKIFGGQANLPAQKLFDETQIHIPLHDAIDLETAGYIVKTIKEGW